MVLFFRLTWWNGKYLLCFFTSWASPASTWLESVWSTKRSIHSQILPTTPTSLSTCWDLMAGLHCLACPNFPKGTVGQWAQCAIMHMRHPSWQKSHPTGSSHLPEKENSRWQASQTSSLWLKICRDLRLRALPRNTPSAPPWQMDAWWSNKPWLTSGHWKMRASRTKLHLHWN